MCIHKRKHRSSPTSWRHIQEQSIVGTLECIVMITTALAAMALRRTSTISRAIIGIIIRLVSLGIILLSKVHLVVWILPRVRRWNLACWRYCCYIRFDLWWIALLVLLAGFYSIFLPLENQIINFLLLLVYTSSTAAIVIAYLSCSLDLLVSTSDHYSLHHGLCGEAPHLIREYLIGLWVDALDPRITVEIGRGWTVWRIYL